MKKLLFVLALGAFAACGNGDNSATSGDSTTVDTTTMAPMDTTSTMAPMDTTHMDTTHADSAK